MWQFLRRVRNQLLRTIRPGGGKGQLALHPFPLCSACFKDTGLRLDAARLGLNRKDLCPHCGNVDGAKLDYPHVERLAYRFFVQGTLHRTDYGGAPVVQINSFQKTDITMPIWLREDVSLLEQTIGIGAFYYGPPLWMLGHIAPLRALTEMSGERHDQVIAAILSQYPERLLTPSDLFYRLRKDVDAVEEFAQYDSPPAAFCGSGRLDSVDLPILYGSQDIEVCVHECRITADDVVHVAAMAPTRPLRLLDLTDLIVEGEEITDFESVDLSVQFLFMAKSHSYAACRSIAQAAHNDGYDGVIYPSYFSWLRTGAERFPNLFGLSRRNFPSISEAARSDIIPNLAIFGRPIAEGKVEVRSINRLHIESARYSLIFGPVGY